MASQHPEISWLQQVDNQMQQVVAWEKGEDVMAAHAAAGTAMADITAMQCLFKVLKCGQTRSGETGRFLKLMKKKPWLQPSESVMSAIEAASKGIAVVEA